jgi:uncharacterized damage-inducible protein DinB
MSTEADPRYPIGKFEPKGSYTAEEVARFILEIESLPGKLAKAIEGLAPEQLDTPYREGGWTVRQVVHHIADSHMNAYIRFKWTLTEDSPLIKAYLEKGWAVTPETQADPQISIQLLKALHAKWIVLLKGLSEEDFAREFTHPETGKQVRLNRLAGLYAWHGAHHTAHITELRNRLKWK